MSHPIIVGVALRDDDGAPLALGRDLARLMAAPLALVHADLYEPPAAVPVPAYEADMRARTLAALERLAEPLRDELEVTVHVGAGSSPAAVLHHAAQSLGASLVVAGSSHRGPVGRVLPGSVTARLLHGATTAVAVAPRGYAGERAMRWIGVAFIDTPEGRDALDAGTLLAGLSGAAVRVLIVHKPVPVGSALGVLGRVPPVTADELGSHQAHAAAETARALLPDAVPAEIEVIGGGPARVLTAASAELDMLVCGSRGYGPLHAVMLGGVSRMLVDGAACPVLVLPRAAGQSVALFARDHTAAVEG